MKLTAIFSKRCHCRFVQNTPAAKGCKAQHIVLALRDFGVPQPECQPNEAQRLRSFEI